MTTPKYQVEGYASSNKVSREYKVNYLARMLAGYDDETWNRLKDKRRDTYTRAASHLLYEWDEIAAQMEAWEQTQ